MASEQTALPISAPGTLTAFRYCTYDVPFWARPNSRDGRWHRVGDPPTQYWSLTPDAAWAELIRAEALAWEEELDQIRMPLWVCTVPATQPAGARLHRSGDTGRHRSAAARAAPARAPAGWAPSAGAAVLIEMLE